ncbi:MAG TPA: NYN domain-containing protein [Vicinamibacteria bacterium]|nr:NYN domain-containing protein [Vicinamibacteria bacterium]
MAVNPQDEQRLGLFIDFENIAIGVRDAHYRKFDINLVLERLLDKGKLLVKKAYADWSRYSDYKRSFHEAAIELIEVPQKSVGGKNSADIRLVVDAMDMSFQKEHINCFVVASGDSDFSPLVSKLKENNKYVIGLGVKNSTSDLLIENCDEFIFYEDLVRGQQRPLPQIANVPEKVQECFALLVDSVLALQRENKEILWGSMVKETMKRKKPSFNETYYGFRTFSHLLEDGQRRGIVTLRRDQRSGSYIVEDLGAASTSTAAARMEAPAVGSLPRPAETPAALAAAAPSAEAADASNGSRNPRRRRGRGRRARGASTLAAGAFMDPAAQTHPDDADAEEGDEHDDGEEALSHEEHEHGPHEEHEHGPREETASAPSPHPESSPAPGPAPTPPPTEPERPAFSLFSWIRRDQTEPPPPHPPEVRKPESRD